MQEQGAAWRYKDPFYGTMVTYCCHPERHGQLESWACANLMDLSRAKHKVLCLDQGNPTHRFRLGREWIEDSPEEKDVEVLMCWWTRSATRPINVHWQPTKPGTSWAASKEAWLAG